MTQKKIALIYATCQGRMIYDVLMQSTQFTNEYQIVDVVQNYDLIRANRSFLTWSDHLANLKKADLFIHQPLGDEYGGNSTKSIQPFLKSSAKSITIPYILVKSFWPILVTTTIDSSDNFNQPLRSIVGNQKPITDLIDRGLTKNQIIQQYLNNQIDFLYKQRFDADIKYLKLKELITDIKVVDYIADNFTKTNLFDSTNHPTTDLVFHMGNQILSMLGFPAEQINNNNDYYRPSAKVPIDSTATKYFNLTFGQSNDIFYIDAISDIFDKYSITKNA
jgi:hypothetical protein